MLTERSSSSTLAETATQSLKTMMSPKEFLNIAKEIGIVFRNTSFDSVSSADPYPPIRHLIVMLSSLY
ncbi:hypothetical protein EON65_53890 [archaeon]|nr:MAG: hypothetical protein EON65_53890 [archaeon]